MPAWVDVIWGCQESHHRAHYHCLVCRTGHKKEDRKDGRKRKKQLVQSAAVTQSGRLPMLRGHSAVAAGDGPCAEDERAHFREAERCRQDHKPQFIFLDKHRGRAGEKAEVCKGKVGQTKLHWFNKTAVSSGTRHIHTRLECKKKNSTQMMWSGNASPLHTLASLDSNGPRCSARAPKFNLFASFCINSRVYVHIITA